MRSLILLAAASAALLAEEHAPTCGTRIDRPAHGIHDVFVTCATVSDISAYSPQEYPQPGRVTQFIIRAVEGDAVRVVVDGRVYFADLVPSPSGGRVGVVFVPGDDHKAATFRVLAALRNDTM